jgi:hypothetical protein
MICFGGELKCFTISRLLRNKLAHSMHGNSEGFAVRVSNVTSAVGKAVAIMQLAQSGLHLLSETKHDESISRRLHSEARCFSSQGDERRAEFVLGAFSKGSCGVGLCAGPKFAGKCRVVAPPVNTQAEVWYHQGRLSLFAVTVKGAQRHVADRGESVIYFFQVYGQVNNAHRADELLNAVQSWSDSLGNVPVFICGDFNLTQEESQVLQKWVDLQVFTDLHVHFASLTNTAVVPTTVSGRRIDHVWANRQGLRLVRSFSVEHDHFATHHTCVFELNIEAFSQYGFVRHKPKCFELKVSAMLDADRLEFIRSIKQQQWNEDKDIVSNPTNSAEARRKAVDFLLDIWSEHAEHLILEQTGAVWNNALHQRGKVQPLKKTYVNLPCTRNNEHVHESKSRIFKVQQLHGCHRRLQAVERMTFGAQRWRTWLKLVEDLKRIFAKAAFPFTVVPTHAIPDPVLFSSLHADLNSLINQIQGHAARLAKNRARDAMRTTAKYKYIRKTALPPQHFVNIAGPGEDPVFTCDISKIDNKIKNHWETIWRESNNADPALERLFLDTLQEGVEVEFLQITAGDVKQAVSSPKVWLEQTAGMRKS